MRTESGQPGNHAPAELPSGVIGRAAEHVRQFLCGLHGHDALLHFEHGRISLQCTSCGYQTPGWDVKVKAAPARTEAPRAARHIIRLPLVGERRVA
jgi:hypothetical protein